LCLTSSSTTHEHRREMKCLGKVVNLYTIVFFRIHLLRFKSLGKIVGAAFPGR